MCHIPVHIALEEVLIYIYRSPKVILFVSIAKLNEINFIMFINIGALIMSRQGY